MYFAGRMGYSLVDRRQDIVELEIVRPVVSASNDSGSNFFSKLLEQPSSSDRMLDLHPSEPSTPAMPRSADQLEASESAGGAANDEAHLTPRYSRKRSFDSAASASRASQTRAGSSAPGEWLSYAGRLSAAVYGDGSPYSSKGPEEQWSAV